MSVTVREAAPDDRLAVRRVLDAAMLDVRDDLLERIESGDVLVAAEAGDEAEAGTGTGTEEGPLLGALVLVSDGDASARVDAVAVRRARRAQGIGSSLVRAAAERHPRLTAAFDADVRPFYESLGFEIEAAEEADDRFRGRYEGASG